MSITMEEPTTCTADSHGPGQQQAESISKQVAVNNVKQGEYTSDRINKDQVQLTISSDSAQHASLPENKCTKCCEVCLNYADLTTLHGVKRICGRNARDLQCKKSNICAFIGRITWAILFMACIAGALYGISKSFIAFRSIPTATTVYTDPVNSLTFPAVTVCNLNGYNISYLEENNLTKIVTEAIFNEGARSGDYNKECASFVPPNYNSKNITLYEIVRKKSQLRDSLIADCRFLGSPCNSSMFTDYITPNGKCFVFNSKNYLQVNGSGYRHDLELELNVQQDKFGGSVANEVGALVSVHEQESPGLVWESGIQVPVGHSAYLAVTYKQIEDRTDRPKTSSKCIQPEEIEPFRYYTRYNYSYRACRGECITQDLADKCGCLWINSTDTEYRNCNISDICCIYGLLRHRTNCICPALCNYTSYEVLPSYSTFPTASAARKMAKKYGMSEETIRKNYLKVHVFYNSLLITREITVRSYSAVELIANIGGNMGLYLGASFLSIIEIFAMLCTQIWKYLTYRYRSSKKYVTTNNHDKGDKQVPLSTIDAKDDEINHKTQYTQIPQSEDAVSKV